MNFLDIPQFPSCDSALDVPWKYLEHHIAQQEEVGLDLSPDFQREECWIDAQRVAYVEYRLSGGELAADIIFNHPGWYSAAEGPYVLVDGQQRLETVRRFMRDELRVFRWFDPLHPDGFVFSEMEGHLRHHSARLKWRICSLETPLAVLQMYKNINGRGTPHTNAELARLDDLIEAEERRERGTE